MGWQDILKSEKEVSSILMEKGITKGYATYWIGYPYEVYSDNSLSFGAVFASARKIEERFPFSDNSAFEKKEGRSCIIFTEDENEMVGSSVNIQIGQQAEDFVIKDAYVYSNSLLGYYQTDLVVYVFDEDVCDCLTDGIHDGVLTNKDMDFNWIGTMDDSAIYMGNGGIVHGPWTSMDSGHYSATIYGANLQKCLASVISESNPESISYTVTGITDKRIDMDIVLDEGVPDFKFVIINQSDDVAEFDTIEINKSE